MPCPGPQVTFWMSTSAQPVPIEMQSSPLLIIELYMATDRVFSMWTPSVFGLNAGELMERPSMWTPSQPSNLM